MTILQDEQRHRSHRDNLAEFEEDCQQHGSGYAAPRLLAKSIFDLQEVLFHRLSKIREEMAK